MTTSKFSEVSSFSILIRRLDGKNDTVTVSSTDTIDFLKKKYADKIGISHDQLHFIFKGKPLTNSFTIAQCNIKAGDRVHIILQLTG